MGKITLFPTTIVAVNRRAAIVFVSAMKVIGLFIILVLRTTSIGVLELRVQPIIARPLL